MTGIIHIILSEMFLLMCIGFLHLAEITSDCLTGVLYFKDGGNQKKHGYSTIVKDTTNSDQVIIRDMFTTVLQDHIDQNADQTVDKDHIDHIEVMDMLQTEEDNIIL